MCFTVQLSRFCCLATAYSYYHIHLCLSRTFFIFFNFFQSQKRRRRDLNPRAAINDLLPFQGSPFGQLGYFSKLPYSITVVFLFCSNSKYDYNALFLICQVLFSIFLSMHLTKRREWDSNPRALADKRFSRPPRYDHFDISPRTFLSPANCFKLSPWL